MHSLARKFGLNGYDGLPLLGLALRDTQSNPLVEFDFDPSDRASANWDWLREFALRHHFIEARLGEASFSHHLRQT